ncbi:hypothetical protein Glove_464g17 [Diversispora epigaea]|uniref:HAT C-terminal dimerisation domain-containing protein n=1 Tax=Diversispora epigaea TaxID=1348612 RepID=A0A397GNS4_9GLOM|nr:hypothetical protein Glove_464g17 [Diversispora epigaea]
MAHAINLIASDFAKIDSVKKIISNCGSIIGFFNNSHAAHGYYKKQLNIIKIKGGEIQSYYKTRWGTLYTTADSIIRSKPVFNWILENHPQFYFNCYQIASIFKPVKELTNILEAQNANLADCFIELIKLGNQWKSIIISNYNRRLGEFINNINILAYWLHLLYRGFGLKQIVLNKIYETASILWHDLGNSEESCLNPLMEIRSWKRKVAPYDLSFNNIQETPMKWWLSIDVQENETDQLQELALLLFSIVPSQAVCKRNFSMLKWFLGERRTSLTLLKIESMAKIRSYYISNTDKEIHFRNKNLSEDELRKSIDKSVVIYDIFENKILKRNENLEQENLNGSEENTEDENISSTILNINQFVNLTLPEFLSTGNNLFESITNKSNINERNERSNMEYNPISLAQRILNEENN